MTRLILHFSNQQSIYFRDNMIDFAQIFQNVETIFTYFFQYNIKNIDKRYFLYHDFPKHYVYHNKKNERR